ncbi:DNA-binding transcriptional regulator, LysR family [Andreprevotia lacus DSM 23236]|jgi:DNA-binding transcriptional LysR family regulator|uniref:DNA-binding transcriptional regulator, LysR family n=1 Tax=Andreprevotia lacus DSM 23236 TaxID=1121001 RepID=A0A1W1WY83_9NEIS|nr:LysR family transcriptional regulator [Andreprevotia lacus]SMC16388.1 DNA-binding transcriptional regulator, LysR family [Andreprevotia lacus DSM 23236]
MDIDKSNIRKLDFSLLLVFDELIRHERTTVVADRLGLSQSAVSHALSRLRELFGDPLFTRRPDGLTPTRRALELAPKVRALLFMTQDVVSPPSLFDPASSDRQFRLAANDLGSTILGEPLLAKLMSEAPSTRLTTRFAVGMTALEALRRDEIDLAIGRFGRVDEEFVCHPLLQERFAVVARQQHPGVGETLSLDDYIALEHVLVSFSGGLTGMADEALARLGLKRRVRASVPMFLTALAAVASSDLVATVPYQLARKYAAQFGLRLLAPPLEIGSFPVYLMRHASTRADPGLDWLVQKIQVIAAALPGQE